MFCSNCGSQIANGMNFCTNCGEKTVMPDVTIAPTQASAEQPIKQKEISGSFSPIQSKVSLNLVQNEVPIMQYSVAFVKSSIAQGTLTLTNKRLLFSKDGAGKAFFKRGGLIGMAMSSGANVPSSISLSDIVQIYPTSCIQGKAAFVVMDRMGCEHKFALQSMNPAKTKELCQARDRIVMLISEAL